jgi:hypothetical protein
MLKGVGQVRLASRLAVKKIAAASRAKEQHISWIRQSKKDEEALREIQLVDPLVRPKADSVKSMLESVGPSAFSTGKDSSVGEDVLLRDIISPSFQGELGNISFGPFGSIGVVNGDVLSEKSEGTMPIFPIPPNLTPYRGLSLEALERGGDELVRELFSVARQRYSEHIPSSSESEDPNNGVPLGSVIPTRSGLFVVAPYFWQGSVMDANQRLRFTIKSVINFALDQADISTVVIPHIGRGSHGYEAEWSSYVLIEEAIEALLELERDTPRKTRSQPPAIVFISNDVSEANEFKDALDELADRWIPERRLTTAPQYHSKSTQRLMVMDESSELDTMRRRDKYKFKQFHGKLRNRGGRYFRETLQPWIWRTQKVLEPPPMLVNEKSGEIASKQLPARPYYFRGLSHTLFGTAHLRTGFPSMRRSRDGQWVGVDRQPDTQKISKPKS